MTTRDEAITGGRELDRMLQSLPVKMERSIMRGALRAGAVIIRDEIKSRAPVASGALRDSIRVTSRAKKGTVSASAKVGNRIAWYAHLVEFGTRPHVILPRRQGGSMQFGGVRTRLVDHPGTTGRPFVRPAGDAATPAAIAAVTKYVRRRLTRQGLDAPDPAPRDPEE